MCIEFLCETFQQHATDEAVLGPARQSLGRGRRVRRLRWTVAAAAAAILVALFVPALLRRSDRRPGAWGPARGAKFDRWPFQKAR